MTSISKGKRGGRQSGRQEGKSKPRAGRFSVQRAILSTVASAGILGFAAVVPGALEFLKYTPQYRGYLRKKYAVNDALNNAVRDGYVALVKGKSGGKHLQITPAGKARLAAIAITGLGDHKARTAKRWDGNWRIVIYDIASPKNTKRDLLRRSLIKYGFICLQQSVWVYPYECQEIVTLLKAEFEVGKNVLYIVADTIENDKALRARFGITYV